jgi:hypothetical protein
MSICQAGMVHWLENIAVGTRFQPRTTSSSLICAVTITTGKSRKRV